MGQSKIPEQNKLQLRVKHNKHLKKSLETFLPFHFSFIQFLFARYMKSITEHVYSSLK